MNGTAARLRGFAAAALSRAGAIVDWADGAEAGEVLLAPDLAGALGCGEHARIATGAAGADDGDLRLDLAGDLLDRLHALVEAAPWTAAVRLAERPPRKLDAAALVERSVDIANARVRLVNASAARAEYQRWHVAVQIAGEESWEDVVAVALSAGSGRVVDLDLPAGAELLSWQPAAAAPDTAAAACAAAAVIGERRAAAFVARLATRRDRDRKRLRDYYAALLAPPRRGSRAGETDPAAQADRRRAVEIELARKLDEVDERSRLRCRVQPVARLRIELPVWRIEVSVQRRAAVRTIQVTWNHLAGGLEPLACAVCGAAGTAFLARDEDVALLCARCHRQ